ncbi:6-phosphogluconolactonase [Legionella brunensis]|uniref:6-phosphogluconolactonase n=1 Tax=Legionella brunensis TaxID=29422 RepID=A0A0W0STT6_9GAMM|nr:6-phosphogluconolactonase [Legionella brunensis]KTC86649.1 6-phosphogluconolactonase [Legionella brunensis]
MQIHQFNDVHQLNQHFAQQIATLLTDAIRQRGKAFLAVSGGKTPLGLFKRLAQTNLDWRNVTITLTDERWLNPLDKDSNEYLVKENLLQDKAAKATFISLYSTADDHCCDEIETRLAVLPTFDVVILGMGEDGHTASLFPCSTEIYSGLADTSSAVLMVNPTSAPYRRISLSKTRLLNSRIIFLHLVGKNKMAALNKALAGSNLFEMPIRAFLHHPTTDIQIMFAPEEVTNASSYQENY